MIELFEYIEKEYGSRGMWISDLAKNLNISITHANMLTLALGYRRGKKAKDISIKDFENNISVKYIQGRILDNVLKKLIN